MRVEVVVHWVTIIHEVPLHIGVIHGMAVSWLTMGLEPIPGTSFSLCLSVLPMAAAALCPSKLRG